MDKSNRRDIFTIIIIGILAFGLQIPWLGFFQDDWNFVFYSSAHGAKGLLEFLTVDGRPGATWVYILGFSLLGYKPAPWQLFTILLRISTAIVFWIILTSLWPTQRYSNLITAIFFLTYPFFTLQPLSVAYAPHFMAYLMYSLSMLLMLRAVKRPEKYLLYSIPAIICTAIHLFAAEYFVGLELIRPFLLWFLIPSKREKSWGEIIRKVFLSWFPYLLILLFFVSWRSIFAFTTGVRNNPLVVLSDSGQIFISVARNLIADLVLLLISSWFKLINPDLFVIGPIRNFYVILAAVIGGVCFYVLSKPANQENEINTEIKGKLIAGSLITAAGLIPVYSIGYIVHSKISPWNGRFALAALLGLALVISGLMEIIITSRNIRHLVFTILIGLLIGAHNYNTFSFKSAWEKQERFYEQLIWRAPSIKSGTALVTNEEVLGYMGDYPTSFGINTMYESKVLSPIPYWFFTLSENFNFSADTFKSTSELTGQKGTTLFHGTKKEAIFFTYQPENQQCLWILRPEDAEFKYLPAELKRTALISNYNNIFTQSTNHSLYEQIVKEDKNTWCYFYQKADLARQMQDWPTVAKLWDTAQRQGYRPGSGFEYIAFIEADAHLGKWQEAYQLTKVSNTITEAMYFILCPTWQRLASELPPSPNKDLFVAKAYELLRCIP
jgi:hypothetical protein